MRVADQRRPARPVVEVVARTGRDEPEFGVGSRRVGRGQYATHRRFRMRVQDSA